MRIQQSQTDDTILRELGARITQIRLNLNMSQAELAEQAGVSKSTVERVENGQSTQFENLIRLSRALELTEGLNTFIPEVPASPITQLKLKGRERRRASRAKEAKPAPPWTWAV